MARRPKKDRYDVIVIGAGNGRFKFSDLFGSAGVSVLVAERHYYAGGYAHSFRRKKYIFDGAVRIVAGAEHHGLLYDLLQKAGIAAAALHSVAGSIYGYLSRDYRFTVPRGVEGLIQTYSKLFPAEKDGIARLAGEMQEIYRATIELLHARDPFSVLSNQTIMKYRYMTFDDLLSQHLTDPMLRAVFAALWSYYGAPPSRGSALYFAYAIMSYFNEEIYY